MDQATKASGAPLGAWESLEADGYDLSVLASNLRKTPLERIRAHDRALSAALSLRKAMERAHAQSRKPS